MKTPGWKSKKAPGGLFRWLMRGVWNLGIHTPARAGEWTMRLKFLSANNEQTGAGRVHGRSPQ